MKHRTWYLQILFLLVSIFVISCSEITVSQKETSVLQSTPQNTSLLGVIWLTTTGSTTKQDGWLFSDYIQLRQADLSIMAEYPDENQPQNFLFENIEPGTYQLLVLIPPLTLSLKNCYDIGFPDNNWELGKILEDSKIHIIENLSYREAYFQAVNNNSSDPKTYEFYAVLNNVKVNFGGTNKIDATFVCKSS